ncbi:MAG: multiprotein bridging factor aMBF1 [Candidatus Bathyarchaeia archaeon]
MRCEVCGRRINGQPFKVIIEGAKLAVCGECSKLGKIYYEEPKQRVASPRPGTTPRPLMIQTKKPQAPKVDTSLELVENFDLKIRQAREKLGLSHEELGKRINEKVSLLRKIETGKMTPDNRLATMLEHALKIKLIVPAKEEKVPQAKLARASGRDLTFGDLIQMDKKGSEKEDTAGRRQS